MKIFEVLRQQCQILSFLSDSELEDLISHSHEIKFSAGEVLISANTAIKSVFVVLDGMVNSIFTLDNGVEKILENIGIGQIPGEAEVQGNKFYQSNYRAIEDSRVLCIPLKSYIKNVVNHAGSIKIISEHSKNITSRLLITQYLSRLFSATTQSIADPEHIKQVELEWSDFEDNVLNDLKKNIEWIILRRGEYLFRKGDVGDGAYILASGVMGVHICNEENQVKEIARITHGEIIGELALVTGKRRSADIIALRDCELFKLDSSEFKYIADKYPRMMLNVYQTISERFMQSYMEKQYRPEKSNIAIFNACAGKSIDGFVKQLYNAFEKLDSIEILSSDSVDEQMGISGISNIERNDTANIGLMHWLNNREAVSRFIFYQADNEWTEWTWRCTSQADEIIIIADINNPPDFTEFMKNVRLTGQTWRLVLVHPENTDRPRNSMHWKKISGAEQIYHARQNNQHDIDRISRILTGRAVSLVLGGGGARGFAHIGVLRALDELGVSIDMIGATSIGAPIASMIAQQKSPQEVKVLAAKAFRKLIDYTLPFTSLIQGKRITRTIDSHMAEWDIEDFWIPFFCMSTNLSHAQQVIHQSGNSARACRASVSIPGVLPPVPDNNDLLVDGGVLNNLPIDVMRNLNPSGTVIAIDVVPPNGPRSRYDYGSYLSGWRQFYRMINPFKKPLKVPALGAVIMQSMVLGSTISREQAIKKRMADYYLNIHVRGVGLLDFNKVEAAEKIGYEKSLQPIQDWLSTQGTARGPGH